ncbi:MAG: hypothetical protein H7838_11165 [Magnetococcus sp. DMHC-8]
MTLPPSSPDQLAARLAVAKQHHAQGDLVQAGGLYEQLLVAHPRHPEVLHLAGLLCLEQGEPALAIQRISQSLLSCPDHPVLIHSLGLALLAAGRPVVAIERFKDATRLQPDYAEAYANWGQALLQLHREQEAVVPLQQAITLDPEHAPAYQWLALALRALSGMELLFDFYQKLAWHYAGQLPGSGRVVQHTFFLDRRQALATARQGQRVPETVAVSGLQMCYHPGEPWPDAPVNLVAVAVAPQALEGFFRSSRFSAPTAIAFDPAVQEERQLAHYIVNRLYDARLARLHAASQWLEQCQQNRPVFVPDQPWRVHVGTSRMTTVMQYNARDLAQGFRRQGCEVLFVREADDRESLDGYHRLQAMATFNPHVVVNINHLNNASLPPEVFNITWWQDRMAALKAGQPLPWRERDLIYAIDRLLDDDLYRCGAPRVQRQGFCYDDEVFCDQGQPRQPKVVVVAISYRKNLPDHPQTGAVLEVLTGLFEAGEPLTDALLTRLAEQYAYPRDVLFWQLWHYVIRDQSVRWLCSLAEDLPVEVYGRHWEADPLVRPFFRGELPHGPAVAAVYNSARYALVPHPFDLHSQRLMEVAACGAIPIVYDCRYRAEPPHWDEQCLWFRTREELRACLTGTPMQPSATLCQGRSYAAFAKRIMDQIRQHLAADGVPEGRTG